MAQVVEHLPSKCKVPRSNPVVGVGGLVGGKRRRKKWRK
jgi:hypothetical protein